MSGLNIDKNIENLCQCLDATPLFFPSYFQLNKKVIEVMAFSESELKKIERGLATFMKKRRPHPEIRLEVDLGYRISGQSLELFEIRPQWDNPSIIREHPFAKATYVKTQKSWKIFWHRADLKWHGYKPDLTVPSIEKFLEIVNTDEYGCFFG